MVRASQKAGTYTLKGQTSTGESQTLKVFIKAQKVQEHIRQLRRPRFAAVSFRAGEA